MSAVNFEPTTRLGQTTAPPAELQSSDGTAQLLVQIEMWIVIWIGTMLSGALLGVALGCLGLFEGEWRAIPGLGLLGGIWAGTVALVVIPHVAIFKWMFWIRCSPSLLAGFVGGLSGCLTPLLAISAVVGLVGAVCFLKLWMHSSVGARLRGFVVAQGFETTPSSRLASDGLFGSTRATGVGGKRSFSLKDLFLRMTAIAVVISFWVFVLGLQ